MWQKSKTRFIFYSRWQELSECEDMIREEWQKPSVGSRMFKCHKKLKSVKIKFLKWRKGIKINAREEIDLIQLEMDKLYVEGGARDWGKWHQLKVCLEEAYKREEAYWRRKARIKWLSEGDKNSRYFHAVTAERRKRN